jgi:molecular chaperone GrpE
MSRRKKHPEPMESERDEAFDGQHDAGQAGADNVARRENLEELELSEEAYELVVRLESERDEAIAARQRAMADFLNYQRRAQLNESQARRDGVSAVVRSLLPALDHFDLALGQDPDQVTVAQLFDGVRIVRTELSKALECHGVRTIAPEIGDPFDPNLHQAVMHQPTGEYEPNSIVNLLQVGYAIGELMIRPASVVVAAPVEEDESRGDDQE